MKDVRLKAEMIFLEGNNRSGANSEARQTTKKPPKDGNMLQENTLREGEIYTGGEVGVSGYWCVCSLEGLPDLPQFNGHVPEASDAENRGLALGARLNWFREALKYNILLHGKGESKGSWLQTSLTLRCSKYTC